MIKSTTKLNKVKGDERTMAAEVIVEGASLEILYEFIGIIDTLKENCPEVLIEALVLRTEEKSHDN